MKVQAIEANKIRRLDNRFKNKEVNKMDSLLSLDIGDGTPIVVELKE